MVRALERWPSDGVPGNAAGWLYTTARRIALDALRHAEVVRSHAHARGAEGPPVALAEGDARLDDEIATMFLCCHPALPRASQLALTLQLSCGFSAAQIAAAFLSDERAIAQRLVRAKQRLREHAARFELPDADELPDRLEPILDVLYLMFNEGYSPSHGDDAIHLGLCREARRLVLLLAELPATAAPATSALAALICLQSARLDARIADDGSLLLLAEQDRARWDAAEIERGLVLLGRSARGDSITRFHIEAGIAACHARAPRHDATDWLELRYLYDALRACSPSPIVEVNRALAVAMVDGAVAGLDELDAIPERALIERYPYALAAYAELHASLGQSDLAAGYLRRALDHQPVGAQRRLLERKLRALGG